MNTTRNTKKAILGIIGLVAAAAVLFLVYLSFAPKAEAGSKAIEVTVVHGDGKQAIFKHRTDAEYLGELLLAKGLIEGQESQYGLFVQTADGETADESQQQWWCITKGGEDVMTGVDQTLIYDGDAFELTFMTGY